STKNNQNLWYQQTRHTIELTNNTPHRGSPPQGHHDRLSDHAVSADLVVIVTFGLAISALP
ncbi:hypothetical protein, partial [Kocuria tytonicola]|uniref:hypothetical protein n=1 Tax=Kocuria tytonicola TaxID=2055946 RepID=UPI001A9F6C57